MNGPLHCHAAAHSLSTLRQALLVGVPAGLGPGSSELFGLFVCELRVGQAARAGRPRKADSAIRSASLVTKRR